MEKILEQARAFFISRYKFDEHSQRYLIKMLNARLADSFFLYNHLTSVQSVLQDAITSQEYDLLGQLAEQLYTSIYQLTSCITALGGRPVTSHYTSQLEPYPAHLDYLLEHIEVLNDRFINHAAELDEGIDLAIRCDDQVTADLLTDILRDVHRTLWFFEELLQG